MTGAEQRLEDAARAIRETRGSFQTVAAAALAPSQAIIAKLEDEVARKDAALADAERFLRHVAECEPAIHEADFEVRADRARAALNDKEPK
jgi:hypothetical protein